ncbi:MAG: fumarylacetoacetate hydrolase family protein [bacterium]
MKIFRVRTVNGATHHATRKEGSHVKLTGSIVEGFEIIGQTLNVEEILPPVEPPVLYGVAGNYRDHIAEGRDDEPVELEKPDRPEFFTMAPMSVIGPESDIVLPSTAPDYVDYEAELAVVIGQRCRNVEEEAVEEYIAGFTCGNDVTARDCQKYDKQWYRAKSFDTFCPIGPCIQTEPPEGLSIDGYLNGELVQSSSTGNMIFGVDELVEFLSRQFTLLPGTVILTGTPAGVGFAREEERFLREGDEYRVSIGGIGELTNEVTSSVEGD